MLPEHEKKTIKTVEAMSFSWSHRRCCWPFLFQLSYGKEMSESWTTQCHIFAFLCYWLVMSLFEKALPIPLECCQCCKCLGALQRKHMGQVTSTQLWTTLLLATSSMALNQRSVLNKVLLSKKKHKIRLPFYHLVKMLWSEVPRSLILHLPEEQLFRGG